MTSDFDLQPTGVGLMQTQELSFEKNKK